MEFKLKPLPYDENALEPHVSQETMFYHHKKHVQKYVDTTNKLKSETEFDNMELEDIVKKADGKLFNNAAQVSNHEFFWECMSPNGGGSPQGKLLEVLEKNFGSFDQFKEQFANASATLFGSGWNWLVKNPDGSLAIEQHSNAGTPLREGKTRLLGIDVWEHAYYIDYRNARPKYIENFWEIVNWDFVLKNLES